MTQGVVHSQVHLQVGKVRWELQTSMPTLRANAHTFMFAIPGSQTFYSVLIAASKPVAFIIVSTDVSAWLFSCFSYCHACIADTPDATVEVLESVLMECTAYQVAGQPMSKADSEQLEDEITEAVLAVCIRMHVGTLFGIVQHNVVAEHHISA